MRAMKTSLIAGVTAMLGATLVAQGVPPTMNQESHHVRQTYIRHMRVFEVTLSPGEATADYRLDHDVAIVSLGDGVTRSRRVGSDWGAAQRRPLAMAEIAEYTGRPASLRTENAGTTAFRGFVIENLRDGDWTKPAVLRVPGTSLRQESRAFAIYDTRLSKATPRAVHLHENPSLVILISGTAEVQGGGGESTFQIDRSGQWFPTSGSDQPHTLMLAGSGEVHLVCVEAR